MVVDGGIEELKQALGNGKHDFRQLIDALPTAIYTTDANGRLTHFNPACIEFSGRTPTLGSDHWCVTWKLYYPDGRPMPHDKCPMAVSLKEGRTVRGAEAIAERPDGTRIWFEPYPTPLFDEAGKIIGGINMLVDITERKRAELAGAHLAAIVANSDDAIISKRLDGVITSWNAAAERLFGYSAKEAIGQSITMLIPADRLDEEPKIIERLKRGERVDHFETKRRRKDGSLVDISLTISPVTNPDGTIIGASKIARDISERKQAEEALRESEERFRTLFEHGPVAVYSCDSSGVIRDFNRRAAELWGRAPAVGDTDERFCGSFKMFRPDGTFMPHERCPMAEVLSGAIPYVHEGEVHIERPDGSRVVVIVAIRPLKNQQGEITGAINCFYDITERKRMEEALRESEERYRDADRRKSEFLAMLSHELRNPLAPVRNAVEILRLAGGDEIVQAASETMERHVSHLVRMVDDLLDVNRISRGKIELRRSRVELSAIVQQAAEVVRPICENRGHELSVTIPPHPIYLDADPSRLAQVLGNLLNNACKFTNAGGRITLTVEQQADHVVIRVSDNGVGIASDQLARIFDMFMQVDTSLERSISGLGIGLALVKNLVELHGGTIEAHSDGIGQGSEFVLRLPIAAARLEPQSPVPSVSKTTTTLSRRILVVDDNRDSAKTMAMLLRLTGHQTHVAFDGLEAVAAAETLRPEVVLLDIGLPKLNGYDTAVTIRQQPWGKDILLVALTGWGQDDDRQKSKDAGFDAHMVKPVDCDALKKLLIEPRPQRT
jgi:PAS domain S-box-containing protein